MPGFDFWKACERAISIDSTSERGNVEYVEFLKTLLAPMDLAVRTEPVEVGSYRGMNLVAEKGGGPDVILLDTHLDTVSGGESALWTETGGDPFRATIRDGKIYGLGAADVKLDFLCKLKALESFVGRRFRNRFILLGTFGEEVGLIGARAFLDAYKGQLDFALIGEPTSLKLVNRHKGRGCYAFDVPFSESKSFAETLQLEFSGRASHSSTPEKGENAIEKAMDVLSENGGPGHLHIQGGHLLNIIPNRCVATVPASDTIRESAKRAGAAVTPAGSRTLADASTVCSFWSAMRTARRAIPADTSWACVTANVDDANRHYIFEFDSRYWEEAESISDDTLVSLPARHRVIRRDSSFFETSSAWHVEGVWGALAEVGIVPEFTTKMGSTEAALFGQRCTALVFGPGQSEGNIHSPNEHNTLSDLEQAIRAYEAILRRLVAAQ